MSPQDLSNEQARHTIDLLSIYQQLQAARDDAKHRLAGGMYWRTVNGKEYLYRKTAKFDKSLGPRSPESEAKKLAFDSGREASSERIAALSKRIADMSRVSRALRLGRVPRITARILRALRDRGLTDGPLSVIGTNALYAYEAASGVHFTSDVLATEDVDLLLDARRKLKMSIAEPLNTKGLIGVLQDVDKSFAIGAKNYSAANKDGFMVDLVVPIEKNPIQSRKLPDRLSSAKGDLTAAEIEGLAWLVSSPPFRHLAIAEDGEPVEISTVDPRAFVLHKMWLSTKPNREPLKRRRDMSQAEAVARLCVERLNLDFHGHDLGAMPKHIRLQVDILEGRGIIPARVEKPGADNDTAAPSQTFEP